MAFQQHQHPRCLIPGYPLDSPVQQQFVPIDILHIEYPCLTGEVTLTEAKCARRHYNRMCTVYLAAEHSIQDNGHHVPEQAPLAAQHDELSQLERSVPSNVFTPLLQTHHSYHAYLPSSHLDPLPHTFTQFDTTCWVSPDVIIPTDSLPFSPPNNRDSMGYIARGQLSRKVALNLIRHVPTPYMSHADRVKQAARYVVHFGRRRGV
jgi:hypothetical protein